MTTGGLVEGRNPDETMDAGLGGHQAEGVLAVEHVGDALEAGFLARLIVENLALQAAPLRPFQIHPEQHFGPVLRLGATGTWMNGHDRIGPVVLAPEHLLDLGRLDFGFECLEGTLQIGDHVLAGLRPLEQDVEIIELAGQ